MRYTSVYTISFHADDDRTAQNVAHQHHEQMLDQLRVEGADHPNELTLDRVIAQELSGPRYLTIADHKAI